MLKVTLELLSDMHIGNGLSDGVVDADFDRDESGRPCVKGSTLKGLLRESCLDLLECLGGKVADGGALMEAVFGRSEEGPGAGAVVFPFLRPVEAARKARTVTGHTQIDAKTGAPAKGRLYLVAHAPVGLRFEGELADGGVPAEQLARARALLSLGLLNLEGVGGKRRAGKGRVKARPADWKDHKSPELREKVIEALTVLKTPPAAAAAKQARGPALPGIRSLSESGTVCALDLTFTAEAPLCLPDGPPTGNRFGCLDHVPPGSLAGLFFNLLKRRGYAEEDIERLLAARAIAFPSLLPVPGGADAPADAFPVPWPLSLEACKKARGEAGHHFADGLGRAPGLCAKCKGAVGPEAGKFFRLSTEGVRVGGVSKTLTMHNRIDRATQTTTDAGVFTQEGIPEGTVFRGRIFFATPELRSFWTELLGGGGKTAVAAFGKGRNRGYGRGILKWAEAAETALPGFDARCAAAGETFSLLLLSPAILLGDSLAVKNAPDGEDLAFALGEAAPFCNLDNGDGAAFSRLVPVFPYNSHRTMPEFPEMVLTPGSVFQFRWKEGVSGERKRLLLSRLECLGIGERRNLGYGRCMTNPLAGVALAADARLEIEPQIRKAGRRLSENAVAARAAADAFFAENRADAANCPGASQLKDVFDTAEAGGKTRIREEIEKRSRRPREKEKWYSIVHDPETKRNLPYREYLAAFVDQYDAEGMKQFVQAAQEADDRRRRGF